MGAKPSQGRHRKSRGARTPDRGPSRPLSTDVASDDAATSHAAKRTVNPLLAAGAAVVAAASLTAGTSAGTPVASAAAVDAKAPAKDKEVVEANMLLAAASSPLNIPINLAIDALNTPYYQVAGANETAAGYMYTGSFWVSNATNVWGSDPGDPPKYTGPTSLLLPNPWLNAPIKQTLTALAIAELPANSTCNATQCEPLTPYDAQGALEVALGLRPFPIINNFFTVPLSALYTGWYADPAAPGQESFAGYVPTNPWGDEYQLQGTKTMIDPATGQPYKNPDGTDKQFQPWAGENINLTDAYNADNAAYLAHLMADPSTNQIKIPSVQDIQRAYTNLFAAGVVAFDPFAPGMSYCPGCVWPNEITPEGIVGALSAADPGNTLLAGWLNNHAWQNSQGAPGAGAPVPSTEDSVNNGIGQSTQNHYTLQQIAQINFYQIVNQLQGKYGTPVNINPGPSTGEVPPGTPGVETTPSTGTTQKGTLSTQGQDPLTAIVTALGLRTPVTDTKVENAKLANTTVNALDVSALKVDEPKTDPPKADTVKVDSPTVDKPKVDPTPKVDPSKTQTPPAQNTAPSTNKKPSFNDRLNDAVKNVIGGDKGSKVANQIGLGQKDGKPGTSKDDKSGKDGNDAGKDKDKSGAGKTGGANGSGAGNGTGSTNKSGDNGKSQGGNKSGDNNKSSKSGHKSGGN